MAHVLETSHREDGSGVGRVLNNGHPVATIHWGNKCIPGLLSNQWIAGATEASVIDLTIRRMESKAKNGMGSVAESKSLALLHQAKAELSGGQATMPDGTPILGASE